MTNRIPLIFAANDSFVPYLSVMVESVMAHGSPQFQYEIILLHRDITKETAGLLRSQISRLKNFSLRLIDLSKEVEHYSFYTENRMFFTPEAYYRLLAPFLLPEYDKAIYIDGDMVACTDVADLLEVELGDRLIAAVRDFCGLADAFHPGLDRRAYMQRELGLKNFEGYYISGLLVMNLRQFRKEFTLSQMMEFAASRQWRYHDQDILNVLTEGRTLLLDARWNVLQDYGSHRLLPPHLYQEWADSLKDPWIVHYGGDAKPWLYPRVPRAEYFWQYAPASPFYHEILACPKRERKENARYRLKYCIQYLLPVGSRSREAVKRWTYPVWSALDRRLRAKAHAPH